MLLGPGRRPVAQTFALAGLVAVAGAASAGAAPAGAAPAADARVGAFAAHAAPTVASVACTRGCGADSGIARGSVISIAGHGLGRVTAVVFLGGRGARDNARARVGARAKRSTRLRVRVPNAARSGRIALLVGRRVRARSAPLEIADSRAQTPALRPELEPVAGIDQLEAGIAARRAGKGVSSVAVAYVSHAAGRTIRIDVVRVADGVSVFSSERAPAAGARQTLVWDGRTRSGVASDGKHEVRLTALAGAPQAQRSDAAKVGGAAPATAPAPAASVRIGAPFTFFSAVFPVRGRHNYGQSAARFGAGRGGRSHEGHDVMAKCGTPVVAARAGVVKHKETHAAAGNYIVISDEVTGQDHAYMHFRAPALVDRGDRVATGQPVGFVGDTGSASACHLHFELWSAPGWYEGGSPIDPLSTLKRWDRSG